MTIQNFITDNIELFVVLLSLWGGASFVYLGVVGGRRVLSSTLVMALAGGFFWAFTIGCAYEPIVWVKTLETVLCGFLFVYGIYDFAKETKKSLRRKKHVDAVHHSSQRI